MDIAQKLKDSLFLEQTQMASINQMRGANISSLAAVEQTRMLAHTLARNDDPKFQDRLREIPTTYTSPFSDAGFYGWNYRATLSELEHRGSTSSLAQENQEIKRQKHAGGKSRQILLEPRILPHKSRLGRSSGISKLNLSTAENRKEERQVYVRERVSATPFISVAEMIKKFESSLREMSISHSTAELEEEMMAKMPRFKAQPVNKKILQASTLSPLPRSTPQIPEFQIHELKFPFTQPKSPLLQTSLMNRSMTVKSSFELELEEIEKAPKFKARPLNEKILERKGELGMKFNTKREVIVPQEFHISTNMRIPRSVTVFDLFAKTRGAEKERKLGVQVTQKQLEEERARIQKANPIPLATDFHVVPPKPEPKHSTNPNPFRLESLVRHKEETLKDIEERKRLEKEKADWLL